MLKHINLQLDILGACTGIYSAPNATNENRCNREKYGTDCHNRLLDGYRFQLGFENSMCDSYVTEKLFLAAERPATIPIVMGKCDEILNFHIILAL